MAVLRTVIRVAADPLLLRRFAGSTPAMRRSWIAGDTGYGNGVIFQNVRERLDALDKALIPSGAYQPR